MVTESEKLRYVTNEKAYKAINSIFQAQRMIADMAER